MKDIKSLLQHIASKLNESENGYSVPTVNKSDLNTQENSDYIVAEFPNEKKFLISVSEI